MSSRATTWQVSRVNCRSPLPSAPSTSASGCRNSTLPRSSLPSLSRPTVRKPRSFSAVSARARFCTVTSGTNSSAPEADFASTPVASGLCRAVVTMALTANAAAERRIAPTLCGSVIWSSTSTMPSGSSVSMSGEGRGSVSASRPWCTASGPRRWSMALGRTISGTTRVSICSSASRRAAFSVRNNFRICRSGLARAADTVCQP